MWHFSTSRNIEMLLTTPKSCNRPGWHPKTRDPSETTSENKDSVQNDVPFSLFLLENISQWIKPLMEEKRQTNLTILGIKMTENIQKSFKMRVMVQNWRSGIVLYGRNHFPKFWEFSDVFVSPVKKKVSLGTKIRGARVTLDESHSKLCPGLGINAARIVTWHGLYRLGRFSVVWWGLVDVVCTSAAIRLHRVIFCLFSE